MKEFISYGHVDSEGSMKIYSLELFKKRIREGFRSTSIEILIRESINELSHALRSYYFAVILKEYQKAYRRFGYIKSLAEIDHELREEFLYYEELDEETGWFERIPHTLRKGDTQVSHSMMIEYCELCRLKAIEVLDWPIPLPGEILTGHELRKYDVIGAATV